MSPQSRANSTDNTTTSEPLNDGGGRSGNPCSSSPSAAAEVAHAANAVYALHKIESSSSDIKSVFLRKRSSVCISHSSHQANQPFLSSYGSAFLSGIFADIAQASNNGQDPSDDGSDDCHESYLPSKKKIRSIASSTGSCSKSYRSLVGLAGEDDAAVSDAAMMEPAPPVVSPRRDGSTLTIRLFNDEVRELQSVAFPSLPQMPVIISSNSCSVVTPRELGVDVPLEQEDEDSSSYGWFVSTDDDDEGMGCRKVSFLSASTSDPDLAFKAVTAPEADNQDIEVQQALAADTVDDVLGDFF